MQRFLCHQQIYQFLSPEMKFMVESGQVRIQINGFSPGSVVVNFIVISSPSENQGIGNVTIALLHSLINSTKYSVEQNNTSIDGTVCLFLISVLKLCAIKTDVVGTEVNVIAKVLNLEC